MATVQTDSTNRLHDHFFCQCTHLHKSTVLDLKSSNKPTHFSGLAHLKLRNMVAHMLYKVHGSCHTKHWSFYQMQNRKHMRKLLVVWQYKTSCSQAFATDLGHCILTTILWSPLLAQIFLIYFNFCYFKNGNLNFVWIQYTNKDTINNLLPHYIPNCCIILHQCQSKTNIIQQYLHKLVIHHQSSVSRTARSEQNSVNFMDRLEIQ